MINDNFKPKSRFAKLNKLRYSKLLPRRVNGIKNYILFDRIVSEESNGRFTVPVTKNTHRYNVRMLNEYCVQEGKNPENLTQDELNKFRID